LFRPSGSKRGQVLGNTCYTWLERNRLREATTTLDEESHGATSVTTAPDTPLLQNEERQLLEWTLEELPAQDREVLVLRELEGLSYKEITSVTGVPMGTVMSRLARARERLQQCLGQRGKKEQELEL
jgi:RNA polymerase sigma-70 factor (ECF subfamily)